MRTQKISRKTGTDKTSLVRSIERIISRPDDYIGMQAAEFLNLQHKEGKARILNLLGLLRDLEHVPSSDLQEVEVVDEAGIEILEPHQTIQEIGYLLKGYTLHPSIQVRGASKILFTKVAADPESNAAYVLTELFKVKRLHLLRTCPACREWFYGRKEDQEFCGLKCRTEHRRETPRGQAIHRAEAKLTYWKNQRDLWGKKISSDAKKRHKKALEAMREARKELKDAQQMTTGV
jgi:hypothetical protein